MESQQEEEIITQEEIKEPEEITQQQEKACQTGEDDESKKPSLSSSFDTIVLTGGALKGLYVLGCLQYCVDNYLLNNVNTYVGTSSGAMICFLLAIGYSPVDIIAQILTSQVIDKIQHFNIFAVMNNLGATSFTFIHEILERMTINKIGYYPTLADIKNKLNKTLIFTTFNLTKDQPEYLSPETHPSLPCLVAIRMSSNLPLIFDHFKYENQFFVDGGIIDNFPIQYAQKRGGNILGIHLSFDKLKFSPTDDFLQYIFKIIRIPITQQQKSSFETINTDKRCTIIKIEDIFDFNLFNFDISNINKLNMFSSGYQQCKDKFER